MPAVWSLRTRNVLDMVQNVGEQWVEDVLADCVSGITSPQDVVELALIVTRKTFILDRGNR